MSDAMPETTAAVPVAPPPKAVLRRLLLQVLNSDADLDGFCFDHFEEEVYARFTNGMERGQKLTMLLRGADASQIFTRLQEGYPKQVARVLPKIFVEVAREQRSHWLRHWVILSALVALGSGAIFLVWRAELSEAPNLILAGYLCSPDSTPLRVGLVDALDATGGSQAIAPGVLDDDGFFIVELLAKAAPVIKVRALPSGCRPIEMFVQSGVVTATTCRGLPHKHPETIATRRWTVVCDR